MKWKCNREVDEEMFSQKWITETIKLWADELLRMKAKLGK